MNYKDVTRETAGPTGINPCLFPGRLALSSYTLEWAMQRKWV
jgi:hypothetical protein